MKLILEEYLKNLGERGELDALLPELLSEMGMDVFSKPQVGPRQYGVDVGAVGKISDLQLDSSDSSICVYLFTIKPGDVSRTDWVKQGKQDIQPSLMDIANVYINNHLPSEYRDYAIKVCLCIGGSIAQEVELDISSYQATYGNDNVELIRCDGGMLARLIETHFLSESVLPIEHRKSLRKSLAFADDAEVSKDFFIQTIQSILSEKATGSKYLLSQVRKVFIAQQVHYIWCKDVENLEASYVASEACVLLAWEATKHILTKKTPGSIQEKIVATYFAIYRAYENVSLQYVSKVGSLAKCKYALSAAVNSNNTLCLDYMLRRCSECLMQEQLPSHFIKMFIKHPSPT